MAFAKSKKRNMEFVLLLVLIASAHATSTIRRFDREKVLRVKPQDEKQVSILKDLADTTLLDFWHPSSAYDVIPKMDVDFRINEDQFLHIHSVLKKNEIQYEVLIYDLQEEIEKQFDVKDDFPGRHSYSKYNDWSKIAAWTQRMTEKSPELISRVEIGKTEENNPMYVLKVGKKSGQRRVIFMDCGIHAREWISPAFCQWFVYQAAKTYGKNKIMTKLLDRLNFYVLPVYNIDGYIWSWTKDRMWRKNRAKTFKPTCVGTDLNRNFNASWDSDPWTNHPCAEVYRGRAPESEKETKAVVNFIQSHIRVIEAYVSIHAYSQMLMFPYGYTKVMTPNHEELFKISKIATEALATRYETEYVYGPIATTIYPTSGSSIDWTYDLGIKRSFAFELRDRGRYGFLLPESQIKATCKETMLAIKSIAKYILKNPL
ncbi:mast cell carboxypeptidase A [Antechinus flavipes]|uniref:mast cell carboxypeptidase A n=1 Tax=Antechinus flavipes TaxID=38775 RepID=UPI002235A71F|nr:mast cell carboxypeptidase A [Antechinus flavipes]